MPKGRANSPNKIKRKKTRIAENKKKDRQKHRWKVKQFIKSLKSVCIDCGATHPAILEFHHTDPDTKLYDISKLRSKKKILEEAKKCVVLCANCHRIRHWQEKH